ncbi:hypothetical protein A5642_05290 [Mycolicibacterium mucogenicum]|uniref:Secreted protein n=1 Tax=Mycolicibacterium mucogenicum TaxID=56689 RepID=A0A1A0LX32_MYCMU|nr:hypothetical protein [Mycolicibacterium mucogenicum]OBA77667.1 hypothetical protein A5642_05290 [Mycolicibacterium mucogenicum]
MRIHRAPRRAAAGAVLVVAFGTATAQTVHADSDSVPHHVTYTVTADLATNAGIYYRDVQPPTWAEYSHNPYEFSPRDDVHLEPGKPWVHEATLDDPDQWAMVTVTTAGQPSQTGQTLRCTLTVDGQVVDRSNGPSGALCSLRNW